MTSIYRNEDLLWFAAQLKPNGLANAQRNLERQGFHPFMPQLSVSQRVRNQTVSKIEPLFPGYIFVGVTPESVSWSKINCTLGVVRLVSGLSGKPAELPDELMAQLFARVNNQGLLQPANELPIGTKATISAGPFTQWVAEVEVCKKGERVDVLLSFMGLLVRTNLSRQELKTI
ncbi:transcription termination/antitermination NusG family protein [Falsihalocynthiibacter sp. S25ZX9]|uniref:transcription termination/antitermination NusG family protein n=1 Tax=Falsihalocynthiibacter sp. S25ZX9 TaxID=3240870 RepID=UPI00351028EB